MEGFDVIVKKEKSMSTVGPISEFEHDSMAIVYDPATGQIIHTHRHSVSHGGKPPSEEALGAAAVKFASEAGHDVTKAAVLHVDPQGMKSDTHYKVDTQKRALVEAKHPIHD
jgi:hypothetical protein